LTISTVELQDTDEPGFP